MNGASAIVKSLERVGVEYTFGIPGSQSLELMDSFLDSSIRNILVTNELSAAFMADGYSRATGKVGVCIAIPGPGLTNMLTGLAEAYVDSSAIVVLVVGFGESDKVFHIHQIEQLEVVRPIVKHIIKIDNVAGITRDICKAFYLAQEGEPGPVVVEIPKGLLNKKIEYKEDYEIRHEQEGRDKDRDKIKQIAEMLFNANLCGIYAGCGASSASHQIKQLAEMLSLPVATTISGKGVFPEDHELSVGFGFGPTGSRLSEDIFKKCDVVLALGCKFSEMATGGWGMDVPDNLIHIDKNKNVLNKNYPAKISLCKDVKIALEDILIILGDTKRKRNAELIEKIKRGKIGHLKNMERVKSNNGIHPTQLFYQLRRLIDRDTVLVTDCGNHQLWAISDFLVFEPRTFITPSDYQAMGFGIPAAIGAKLGCADRRVICICGDGGFLISGFELLTAVREKINLSVIIFNDGALGLIKGLQKRIYGRVTSVDFVSPDYENLAKALHIGYLEIKTDAELITVLKQLTSEERAVLVNIKIKYDELPKYIRGIEKTVLRKLALRQKIKLISKRMRRTFFLNKSLKNREYA